jgi:toxin ParE1/3/4
LGEARPLNLRYTPKALAELADILAYIAERSPAGARNVQARIMAITTLLTQYPLSGQMTSESGFRKITTSPYPFAIFYEVTDEEIIVIGIRHTARDPASNPG